ncbi:DUF281 domain-containing protein [Caenorhabditis elegans]|uniref:DUF281 domain-containing protein n=1 Tax=Caenorhabditis elegans TaxID=6239 RepID=O76595_CAEEL|nr:DUF281 domain-containing protein [Caenorhabditis elegans]CCD69608.1 DUF281 domain-containing protein [Caenorhabditis elegans]|eukprot:NP_494264.2 Uncharacterized protein CELE_F16G10.10 [Caenorhabditis elegans]
MSKISYFVFLTLCLIGHMEAKCIANLPSTEMMATSTIETSIVTESTTLSTTQLATENNCPVSQAKCPDLLKEEVVQLPMTIEKVDGCDVFVCPENTLPYVLGSYEGSELPKADNGEKDFLIPPPLSMADLGGGTINDYYGLTCENNLLTASKYPRGINPGLKNETVCGDGSLNGKKGLLTSIRWRVDFN